MPLPSPPRALLIALPTLALLLSTPAIAGWFGKDKDKGKEPPPDPPERVEQRADPIVEKAPSHPAVPSVDLWSETLPHAIGGLPEGLANVSAQGCAACHGDLHDAWAASGHAEGPSEALRRAAADANEDQCLSCHLPLDVQHRQNTVLDAGDPARPKRFDNPAFDATLAMEGVTCVSCHVRDGQVIGKNPHPTPAPHAAAWSEQLGDARSCAPCHQMTWPGADRPLYDTVGEWERSAYPAAQITCASCHLEGSAGHGMSLPAARAVSLITQLPPAALVRGKDPVQATFTLQNTGAGHAFPTGSPWQGVRLTVSIEGPKARGEGRQTWGEPFTADLMRSLSSEAPWTTTADTRLPAAGSKAWTVPLAIPVDAPTGDYTLRATLHRTRIGADEIQTNGEPILVRELALAVE